ncbi:para-aminobenzoic acid synthetase [Exidia glandulosa HHB12029]|uniref:aminodeoxychorismate synthase n=1 Tax=Exidia glandulosa HHB12029 TaxID=1314781 RepID=A0A165IPW6_EXIGL|nr:para-aminobenzoic acid synthetase [Exidia glandulosa HHB12029]
MGRDGAQSDWRVLLIDAYDSFTCNLAQLVRTSIPGCAVWVVKNDALDVHRLHQLLPFFDAVVVGPGPGSPEQAEDIGVVPHLWALQDSLLLPVLGVCLGLQSLALAFGGSLSRLRAPQHGRIAPITHCRTDLFADVCDGALAVRYHSLRVTPGSLRPLAWVHDEADGEVLMGARHPTKPFWAVQYHPESVCTSVDAAQVVHNFGKLAREWTMKHPRRRVARPPAWMPEILDSYPLPSQTTYAPHHPTLQVQTEVVEGLHLSVPQICALVGASNPGDFILLDSAAHPGRYSIVACTSPQTLRITHYISDDFVTIHVGGASRKDQLGTTTVWDWLADFMRVRVASGGLEQLPFWGGLVGYFSYETGVQSLDVLPLLDHARSPDVNLLFAERSIVLDSHTGHVFVQSIRTQDHDWLAHIRHALSHQPAPEPALPMLKGVLELPDKRTYLDRIRQAQDYLAEGQSYELCLTTQTRLRVSHPEPLPRHLRSWDLYQRLRARNPAPYAAYMRLGGTTLVGSSPERFLSWDRSGRCELRPIKGTVKKGAGMTREKAEEILRTPKEAAENLMIVDLIRHDLHALAGDGVRVTQLMGIEEYRTVWQLVSVIEGRVRPGAGFGVLQTAFPPGSMVGAPKKRSVELLQGLENEPRGIYSGVCGYWCAGGGGDWSVVIRSCFNEARGGADAVCDEEVWGIGAGGAITTLSDAEAEWEEMVTKLGSVISALG